MESYEHRVVNGLLKAGAVAEPEQAISVLQRDFRIISPPSRAAEDDLWPAIWALAAVLERQFAGTIYVDAGLTGPLRQPAQLGSRCRFDAPPKGREIVTIGVGCQPSDSLPAIYGDASGSLISCGTVLGGSEAASPLSCFALAGYLGFAALAEAARIPPYRREFARPCISLPYRSATAPQLPDQLDFVGLGHLGEAYLSLLFFILPRLKQVPRLSLIDKGAFEEPNWATQILIEKESDWIGANKAEYLECRARQWGCVAESRVTELAWGWQARPAGSRVAVLGLDKFEPRRIAMSGGYEWVFDAGLGDSFLQPRISWHSLRADKGLAARVFADDDTPRAAQGGPRSAFLDRLRNTPGGCGILTYESVQASAPSLGLVAAALTWSELMLHFSGENQGIRGSATIWSAILPHFRTTIEE